MSRLGPWIEYHDSGLPLCQLESVRKNVLLNKAMLKGGRNHDSPQRSAKFIAKLNLIKSPEIIEGMNGS